MPRVMPTATVVHEDEQHASHQKPARQHSCRDDVLILFDQVFVVFGAKQGEDKRHQRKQREQNRADHLPHRHAHEVKQVREQGRGKRREKHPLAVKRAVHVPQAQAQKRRTDARARGSRHERGKPQGHVLFHDEKRARRSKKRHDGHERSTGDVRLDALAGNAADDENDRQGDARTQVQQIVRAAGIKARWSRPDASAAHDQQNPRAVKAQTAELHRWPLPVDIRKATAQPLTQLAAPLACFCHKPLLNWDSPIVWAYAG